MASQDKTTCPECGAPLEATAVSYLEDVKLDEHGHVTSHRLSQLNDPDGFVWDDPRTRVHCANDHEVYFDAPKAAYAAWAAAGNRGRPN